jgi:predicted aldo/keto reductase-like oxidoreductase
MGSVTARRKKLPHFKDRLVLGDQGLRVSPFCMGAVRSPDTVLAAFEAGINFFFITTDMHWPLYEATRQGVRQLLARGPEVRDQIVVAGVCYQTVPYFCEMPFEQLVNEIPGLDRLDVLVAGTAFPKEYGDRLPVYQEYRRDRWLGARAIGTSFHDRPFALSAIRDRLVELVYIRYNPGHPGAREDVFPYLSFSTADGQEQGVRPLLFNFKSTFAYAPPARMEEIGFQRNEAWHPDITDHYRFVLTRPEIDGILMAPKTPEQVEGLCRALAKGPLTDEEERYLIDVSNRLGMEILSA